MIKSIELHFSALYCTVSVLYGSTDRTDNKRLGQSSFREFNRFKSQTRTRENFVYEQFKFKVLVQDAELQHNEGI